MQRNILYHSYTYLGQTFEDDELRHWKYISKERKNGRWVYTYKNDKYENSKQSLDNAKQNYDKKFMNYAVADSNVQVNGKLYNKDGKLSNDEAEQYGRYSMERDKSKAEYEKAEKNYDATKSKYYTAAISTLPSRIIGNGATTIANIFSNGSYNLSKLARNSKKAFKEIRKAISWF